MEQEGLSGKDLLQDKGAIVRDHDQEAPSEPHDDSTSS
jgi:hypothetical protein